LSTGTVVDNVESYHNEGPSWWFDFENYDWTVTENYFHDNTGNGSGDTYDGAGFQSEGPGGGGELSYNVFTGLTGSAIGMYETQGHDVHDNLMNGTGIQMRYGCHDTVLLSGLTFHGNFFHNASYGEDQPCGGAGPSSEPGGNGVTADYDTFDVSGGDIWTWISTSVTTPAEAYSELGVEQNGTLGTVAWPP